MKKIEPLYNYIILCHFHDEENYRIIPAKVNDQSEITEYLRKTGRRPLSEAVWFTFYKKEEVTFEKIT